MILEAGVKIPLQALWINGDGTVRFRRKESSVIESFKLVHDAFFFSLPEVDYHADSKQVTVMKDCIMVIEGFINEPLFPCEGATDVKVDRVSFLKE